MQRKSRLITRAEAQKTDKKHKPAALHCSGRFTIKRKGEKRMSSESTKNLKPGEVEEIRKRVLQMDDDALAEFRNGFDADEMGFDGEEA